jgi:hypothetical protein
MGSCRGSVDMPNSSAPRTSETAMTKLRSTTLRGSRSPKVITRWPLPRSSSQATPWTSTDYFNVFWVSVLFLWFVSIILIGASFLASR